jgi:uncharacterized phiE125 gp8 family phage protein
MHVKVIIPPGPLATWDEARSALNIEDDEDQDYVELLIAAASAWIDGPDGCVGKSIGPQTLEARLDAFDGTEFKLPFGPVNGIVEITYLDPDRAEQTLASGAYDLLAGGVVALRAGSAWPSVLYRNDVIGVQYEAGSDEVPVKVKQAVLLLVGHWYRSRQAVVVGTIASDLPLGVDALLSTERSWS